MEKKSLISRLKIKKTIALFLAFSILSTQMLGFLPFSSFAVGTAYAAGGQGTEVYDVVALVVEKDLLEEDFYAKGLIDDYEEKLLGADTLGERIERFAEDLQDANTMTITETLLYDPEEDNLIDLITALENLYKNGSSKVNSRLRGVVLIGEIPLPVVNKNGNRFISIYPLTDFDDKAYIFNPLTESFERNNDVSLPKPEIWHGVLRAPEGDMDKFAMFFDKNHLYREEVDEFVDFERRLLFADLVAEEKSVNEDKYKLYQNFIDNMDDLVYMRFNKHWARDLYTEMMGDFEEEFEGGLFQLAPDTKESNDFQAQLDADAGADPFAELPDIFAKEIINKYHIPYIELVSKYLSVVNDFIENTGRYSSEDGDVDTLPALISMKDEFAKQYLKQGNDAIERKINQLVEMIDEPLVLIDYVTVKGQFDKDDDGDVEELSAAYKNINVTGSGTPGYYIGGGAGTISEFRFENNYSKGGVMYINGVSSDAIQSPKQCYPYLGSMFDPESGEYSVLTRSIRSDNISTGVTEYSLGINGVALSAFEAGILTNQKYDHGFLIESNEEYGYPATFNDGPVNFSEEDIILSIKPVYYVDTFSSTDFSPPDIEYKLYDDGILKVDENGLKDDVEMINEGKYYSFYTDAPLVECKSCRDFLDVFGYVPEDGLEEAVEVGVGEDKQTIEPFSHGFFKIASDTAGFYYLSSMHGEDSKVDVNTKYDLDYILSEFNKTVGNLKKGGSDEDGVYWDERSYILIEYIDGPVKAGEDPEVVTSKVYFDDLAPIYSIASNSAVYADNDLKGCFYSSAMLHDDRCFSRIATYPVLDPAGSYEAYYEKGTVVDGATEVYDYQFPVGEKVLTDAPEGHRPMFQLPSGRTFEEVDEIYVDSCFDPLPETDGAFGTTTFNNLSLTVQMMNLFGKSNGKKNQNVPYGGKGANVPYYDSASDFVINSDPPVDLGTFAEMFGLYDGVDNDGDGITDYKSIDKDGDGWDDAFIMDMDEAAAKYGLDPDNLSMVGRYLLGKRYKWENPVYATEGTDAEGNVVYSHKTVPAGQYWYPFLNDPAKIKDPEYEFNIEEDGILKVTPHELKMIPSLIVHNEPTAYTIASQVDAGMSFSLPIDDPRYVAFMDVGGDVQRVDYLNLFDLGSYEEFASKVYEFAAEFAKLPGAADKLPGANGDLKKATDYVATQILSITTQSSEEAFLFENHQTNMIKAAHDRIRDAISWNGLSIDDKHEYVLKYYLNASEDFDPFIHDSGLGYEAVYLVFDGGSGLGSDYIDMNFERPSEEETDPLFNPYTADYDDYAGNVDVEGYPIKEEGEEEPEFEFVSLKEFFKDVERFGGELKDLLKGDFASKPCCGGGDEEGEQVLDSLVLTADKEAVYSDGLDSVKLTVSAIGDDGLPYTEGPSPTLEINISQDNLHPVLEMTETDMVKSLDGGYAVYKLMATTNPGSANVQVTATFPQDEEISEVTSDALSLQASEKSIELIVSTDSLVAGSSEMISLTANLMEGGVMDQDGNSEVTFSVLAPEVGGESGEIKFLGGGVVNAVNGVAEVDILAFTKAGPVIVQANTTGGAYHAPKNKEIFVLPDETAKIEILSDTNVLEANSMSSGNLTFRLLDQYGNLVNNSFLQIAVFAFGDAVLDEAEDQSPLIPGVQMNVSKGFADISLHAQDKTGEVSVYVVLLDQELSDEFVDAAIAGEPIDLGGVIGASKKFTILQETKLQATVDDMEIPADGESVTRVSAKLTKVNGDVLTGYNGPVVFKINDPTLAVFDGEVGGGVPAYMVNGEAEAYVRSTTRAGTVNIEVEVPGFSKSSKDVVTLPGKPVSISLTSSDDVLFTGALDATGLQAKLIDKYGNIAYNVSPPVSVTFKATDSTANMIEFAEPFTTLTSSGIASTEIKAPFNSGRVNLMAESKNLETGILSLDIKKRISNITFNNFQEFAPKALYINLLGADFFDLGENDLASALLYNGQSQAVLTTTADTEGKKPMLFVDGYGQIEILDDNVASTIVNATDTFKFTRVKFIDTAFSEELGEMFVVPKDGLPFAIFEEGGEEPGVEPGVEPAEGIIMRTFESMPSDVELVFSEDQSEIYVQAGGEVVGSVDKYGRINVASADLELKMAEAEDEVDVSYFSILLGYKGDLIGQVVYKQDVGPGVNVLSSSNKNTSFFPGIYLKLANDHSHFAVKQAFSKYSTEFFKGAYIVDLNNEMGLMMAAGFGQTSVEDTNSDNGVGFAFDNKNLLLFSAGNSVGESNLPYASEVGIVLGDPTVRIDSLQDDLVSSATGFTRDLGRAIYSGDEVIKGIESFDYNGDGYDDVVLFDGDGKLRLLQNEISNERFKDQGILLSLANGIGSLSKIDVDDDGFDDLIIGTEESCIKGEKCLYLFKNNNGNFERQNLAFDTADKIFDLQTADMNRDGYPDIVLSDSSGNVYVFWNEAGEISPSGDKLGNFGIDLDDIELIGDVMLDYSGMPKKLQNDDEKNTTENINHLFVTMTLGGGEPWSLSESGKPIRLDFIGALNDPKFKTSSSKTVSDLNGAPLELGDSIEYTIKLKNSSGSKISGLILSDIMPSAQDLDEGSLVCVDAGCSDPLEWIVTDLSLRSRAIAGVTVPANGTRTVSYKATINSTPAVSLSLGDFDLNDKYLDVLVRPDVNQDNSITYFYSSALDDDDHVVYTKFVKSTLDETATNEEQELQDLVDRNTAIDPQDYDIDGSTKDDISGESDVDCEGDEDSEECQGFTPEATPELPRSLEQTMKALGQDSDFDLIPDSWDNVSNRMGAAADLIGDLGENIADGIEDAVANLRCSGAGCLPIPYNYAFLVPSANLALGFSPFAWGLPYFPGVGPAATTVPSTGGRFYISPTLTMGLGMAICLGPSGAGLCFAFALPLAQMSSTMKKICDSLNKAISKAVSAAVDFTNSTLEAATTTLISNGESGGGAGNFEHNGALGSEKSPLTFKDSVNVRIPGFPSFLTNWFDGQLEEIFDKLLDLPEIYIILPELSGLFKMDKKANQSGISGVQDFLKKISSIPLVQIRGEEVVFKIPSIDGNQLTKWKRQAELFIKNLEEQIEKAEEFWTCDENAQSQTLCDKVTFKLSDTIGDIKKILDLIEFYKNLPKKIFQWRTIETKYATQIICYLDEIMDLTAGYIKRQGRIVRSWVQATTDIVNQFRSWKALLDIALDYQESCDSCKNERYGTLGILLQLFAVIPDIPIIPVPSWPDIVFDMSKVQLGAEIVWPDVVFKPEPIILPDLPTINLPELIPSLNIDLDGLIPDLDLSWLPDLDYFDFEFPDLPPLPLPQLPDLPRPPKIPKLPKFIFSISKTLKVVFKILCLLKEGLIPIVETSLKTEIETLTNAGVKPVLPITLGISLQFPSIPVETPAQIDFVLKSKFGVNTTAIYNSIKTLADYMNKAVEDWVAEYGGYIKNVSFPYIEDFDRKLQEDLGYPPNWDLDSEKLKNELQSNAGNYYVTVEQTYIDPSNPILNKALGELDYVDVQQFADDSYLSEIAEARNSLLSYANGVNDSKDELLNIESLDELNKFVAEHDDRIASTDFGFLGDSFSGGDDDKLSIESYTLIAGINDSTGVSFEPEDVSSTQSTTPQGIFVYPSPNMPGENILNYTDELGEESHILFSDVDEDGDDDIVFSMGGDVYLKENYMDDGDALKYFPIAGSTSSLSEYADDGVLSVQGFTSSAEGNGSATMTFIPSNDPRNIGYELVLAPSIDGLEGDAVYRYLLVEDASDVFGVVGDVFGIDNVIEAPERKSYSGGDEFKVEVGDVLYTFDGATFVLIPEGTSEYIEMELESENFYQVGNNYPSAVEVKIMGGDIMVIKEGGDSLAQPISEGMPVVLGDKVLAGNNGGMSVSFTNGAEVLIDEDESFEIMEVRNLSNPSVTLPIPNGNYYAVVYSLNSDGKRSFSSTQSPLAPQICGDDKPPLPALSDPEMSVAVTKTLELDASASFDPSGVIKEYYIDLDPEKDADGNGIANDDYDLWSDLNVSEDGVDDDGDPANDKNNPKFNLGPFDQVGDISVALNIVDEANNRSTQMVLIHVYVPVISLDPVYIESAIVSGETDPSTSEMPFSLMRERLTARVEDGQLKYVPGVKKIVTPSADESGQYMTLNNGTYVLDDFDLDDIIWIIGADGSIVGEIDSITGNFWLKDGYSYEITPAVPPTKSTQIEFFGPGGESLGTMYFVSDANTDVSIYEGVEFTADNAKDMYGVNVSDVNLADEFEFKNYPANDPNYPNGVYLYYKLEKKHMVAIDTAGNILILDDRMTLGKKKNAYKYDPFVYEMFFEGQKIAEVYISVDGLFDEVQIVGPSDVPSKFPNGVTPQYLYEEKDLNPYAGTLAPTKPVFNDLTGTLHDYAMSLYYQGLLDGDENFDPEALISRADFVVMLIKMLCIVPRDEAYEDPALFYDLPYEAGNLPYYYPYVKEAALLGLVHGYGGEVDPNGSGLNPFKPSDPISLSEAVKVIVSGLDLIDAIDISELSAGPGEPWYAPYFEAAQNLTKYEDEGVSLKNSFVITEEESLEPEKDLSKGEVLEIAYRVLDAYNCLEIDNDNDGMPDYCEKKYGIDDPSADEDEDDLINSDECYYGTDPKDYDTDDGSVGDGDEVKYGTHPLDGNDDQNDIDGDGLLDIEEVKVYGTDPNNADTDGGGVYDGQEVENQTDPLKGEDDYAVGDFGTGDAGQIYETEAGIYLVPPDCATCPCWSTFEYKADLRKGDILYTIIVNKDENKVYSKSNEQNVK